MGFRSSSAGLLLLAALLAPGAVRAATAPATPAATAPANKETIVAVVNGDIVTSGDVNDRGRLFALSTGLPVTPEVLARLRPQITRQLIDERLRWQAEQKHHIVVPDQAVADAIKQIEQRNNLAPGALRERLAGQGVTMRTLIDEIRVQIGWTSLLREELADKAQITDSEIAARTRAIEAEKGQPEYHVAEIFIPVENPKNDADAQRFADTVIAQLHAGAPFAVVAAQFSQSQSALQGGDMGWVRADQLDPEVAKLASEMPVGAVSNPIPVAGGYTIMTLLGRHGVGEDMATILSVRQAFFPFTQTLNPAAPTAQQMQALQQATRLSHMAKSCDAVAAANQAEGAKRPADPGQIELENVNPPALRKLLATLPPGKASQPLVANDGILVMMVCSREQQNLAAPTKKAVKDELLAERIELYSRQMMRDLRRRAIIERRSS